MSDADYSWLYYRRKHLRLTQSQLVERLKREGLHRSQSTIALWERPSSIIPSLGIPEEAQMLASALNWTVREMLIAAGYPLEGRTVLPHELVEAIELLNQLHPTRRLIIFRMLPCMIKELIAMEQDGLFGGGSSTSSDLADDR